MSGANARQDAMHAIETPAGENPGVEATAARRHAPTARRELAREILLLTHTMGVAGWQARHEGGGRAFVLAAFGRCFIERRISFNLPLLWRLRRLWREGAAALDPRALRLALWLDERVVLRGARVDVHLAPPAAQPKAFGLGLRTLRERGPEAEAPARVFGLASDSHERFRRLTRDLGVVPKGSALRLLVEAEHSAAPPALRAEFPLRVDLRLHADEDYVTLIRARTVEARLTATER
ncbi:MAG: hypothetical protein BroJett031_04180 [Betaproteobacteria bacterium]|nr:MAG: hypothetical protein BroJett031_04180 [Betaproteobacteria bacterium]